MRVFFIKTYKDMMRLIFILIVMLLISGCIRLEKHKTTTTYTTTIKPAVTTTTFAPPDENAKIFYPSRKMAKESAKDFVELAKRNIDSGKCESATSIAEHAKKIYEYVLDEVREDMTVNPTVRNQSITEYEGYIEDTDKLIDSAREC